MIKIYVPGPEFYNEETEEFGNLPGFELEFNHSLVSLSKWEAKYKKPFLSKEDKTPEETIGYIRTMLLTPDVTDEQLMMLTEENLREINEYINDPQTATWFSETANQGKKSSEVITADLIYYWMDAFDIEWEAQHWHLGRLFTLIKVHDIKQKDPKKMSRGAAARQMRELNAQRRAKYGTSG